MVMRGPGPDRPTDARTGSGLADGRPIPESEYATRR